jgi:hypothetical protein
MSYSGDYTGEKTVDTSHCRWQWWFEKIGNILLKFHRSAKMPDLLNDVRVGKSNTLLTKKCIYIIIITDNSKVGLNDSFPHSKDQPKISQKNNKLVLKLCVLML